MTSRDSAEAKPFSIAPESTLLITTRRASVAEDLLARITRIEPMLLNEARSLLERWMGRQIRADELAASDSLLEHLELIPLGIELAGSLLSKGLSWNEALGAFESDNPGLSPDAEPVSRQLEKMRVCIRMSTRELHKRSLQTWERFATLGLVARGSEVRPKMASIFWSCSTSAAVNTIRELEDDALLRRAGQETCSSP
jgi:hypothetical protein